MHILILSKRQYTNKDLLDDKYGRVFELASELNHLGHRITGLSLSYQHRLDNKFDFNTENEHKFQWFSFNKTPYIFTSLWKIWQSLMIVFSQDKPDVIWAGSDVIHIFIAHLAKRKYHIPVCIDLYDNLESFGLTKIPSFRTLLRHALKHSDAITCISSSLSEHVQKQVNPKAPIYILENAIPRHIFHTMNKNACRKQYQIPPDAICIGTVGSLTRDRGIDTLYKAFELLSNENNNIHLVLAGKYEDKFPPPDSMNVHYLGAVEYSETVSVFNILDAAIICNVNSEFGKYCFPQKFYEIVACKIPLLAANVGVLTGILKDQPYLLYEYDNEINLAQKISGQLAEPRYAQATILYWDQHAENLEKILSNLIDNQRIDFN